MLMYGGIRMVEVTVHVLRDGRHIGQKIGCIRYISPHTVRLGAMSRLLKIVVE